MVGARQAEASSYASNAGSSTYDVFLNFRGEDTRKNFTGHLHRALKRKGFNVFMDSHKLREGENIGPELFKAIQGSKISITIFSKSYANSKWCLMELAQIVECYKSNNQIVLPIFLDVEPVEVLRQSGTFEEAFCKHERKFQLQIVDRWREALRKVATLRGWFLNDIENGEESRLIELVVERSFNIVSATTPTSMPKASFYASAATSSTCDVFLNFRGDTRKGFTSHLHSALKRERIDAFMDSKIQEGEAFGPKIVEAIKMSKISIPVFSKGYANSRWCLMELVKILECHISNHQIVLPIFFDVEPSDVRSQTGSFEAAFLNHERDYPPQVVKRWREALTEVGSLKGWVLNQTENGDESSLIELVVKMVLRQTSSIRLSDVKHPVGLDDRVNDFESLLDIGSKDVQFVGICGKGGMGKTSIAKALYNRNVESFDQTGFLANIREEASRPKGLLSLQEKLIYSISKSKDGEILNVDQGKEEIKKRCLGVNVLLVLDDVDDRSQLDALAIDLNWFGQGSRVIITTRDEHILNVANIAKDKIFRPKELDDDQSLQLFLCHAFQKEEPFEEYIELSRDVACYTGGLPLALEVLGSYLSDIRNKEVWEDTLQTLKENLHKEVHERLKISYDNLENNYQKIIFLDAACFFVGWEKETLISMWEACGYHPKSAVEKLIQRSLLKFNKYERLEMHDLIRDMGRKIVFEENPMEPSKRSRLWSLDDILEVLEGHNKGTDSIKGILLPFNCQNLLSIECLAKVSNLRFLDLTHSKGDDVPHLPYRLRWFRWIGCPIKVLPDDFYHRGLVHLDLSWSQIQLAWNNRPLNEYKKFQNLKVLRLSRCGNLSKCPDFSWFPCLEQLDLNWCDLLGDLDDSIGQLSNLKRLILSNCESLSKLPQSISGLKSLVELQLRKTGIDELPDGVGLLEKLKVLSVEDCKKLVKLPRSMERMRSLHSFNLNGTSISKLPNDFLMLSSLVELYMSGNVQEQFNICSLPIHFSGFSQLQKLKLSACRSLESLPADLSDMKNLQELFIGGWEKLQCLPELPSSLTSLECLYCKSLAQLPDLSCLKSLRILSLEDCYNLEKIQGLEGIESLVLFWVERCYKVTDTPRKHYFQVRSSDDGLERYDPLFPSPRCLGALRRLTNNQRPKAGSDLCLESERVRDYSFSNANDGSCKQLSLIIVFSFPSDLNGYLVLEGELVDVELDISTDIFWKDGKSTQCNHTVLIENVAFTVERDIVYIHDLEGFTWFGFPLEGKNAMTELYVHGRGLYKRSDSGIYCRLRYSFSCVKLKFWSLEYVNEESGQSLPNQEWVDRIVKDILSGPWPHVDSGARSHTVFDSHSALIEEENFGSMQHILHRGGRTRSSQFHDQFVRTDCFGLEEPEEDMRSAEKDRFDSHSVLEQLEEDKRSTEEIDSHPLFEEDKFSSACFDGRGSHSGPEEEQKSDKMTHHWELLLF